ncbi:MAG: hypothetical protein HN750_17460 [Gemmatimonadales bacterium]|nr:hypothetical protein [Gemmatimonadales bacterium]
MIWSDSVAGVDAYVTRRAVASSDLDDTQRKPRAAPFNGLTVLGPDDVIARLAASGLGG